MRNFYIFKINNEFSKLAKEYPYHIYKTMEQIYFLDRTDYDFAARTFETVAIPLNKNHINSQMLDNNRHNQFYIRVNNIHKINNYYTDEQTELIVKNAHIELNTTIEYPKILEELKKFGNFFVCDFQNKDYFWLN